MNKRLDPFFQKWKITKRTSISKSKIEGAVWEYIINIKWKLHQIIFSGVGGAADKYGYLHKRQS